MNRDEDFISSSKLKISRFSQKENYKITKDLFLSTMDRLKQQFTFDKDFAEKMGICFPDSFVGNLFYNNGKIVDALIILLREILNDENDWIEYWVYELEFGELYTPDKVTDSDGSRIKLETAEDLWNLLKGKKQ